MLELILEALLEMFGVEAPKKQQRRVPGRRETEKPPARTAVPPSPPARPAGTYRPQDIAFRKPAARPQTMRAAPEQPARRKRAAGHDFAARLRNNPAAAREAFVYSVIFGRPLGDR